MSATTAPKKTIAPYASVAIASASAPTKVKRLADPWVSDGTGYDEWLWHEAQNQMVKDGYVGSVVGVGGPFTCHAPARVFLDGMHITHGLRGYRGTKEISEWQADPTLYQTTRLSGGSWFQPHTDFSGEQLVAAQPLGYRGAVCTFLSKTVVGGGDVQITVSPDTTLIPDPAVGANMKGLWIGGNLVPIKSKTSTTVLVDAAYASTVPTVPTGTHVFLMGNLITTLSQAIADNASEIRFAATQGFPTVAVLPTSGTQYLWVDADTSSAQQVSWDSVDLVNNSVKKTGGTGCKAAVAGSSVWYTLRALGGTSIGELTIECRYNGTGGKAPIVGLLWQVNEFIAQTMRIKNAGLDCWWWDGGGHTGFPRSASESDIAKIMLRSPGRDGLVMRGASTDNRIDLQVVGAGRHGIYAPGGAGTQYMFVRVSASGDWAVNADMRHLIIGFLRCVNVNGALRLFGTQQGGGVCQIVLFTKNASKNGRGVRDAVLVVPSGPVNGIDLTVGISTSSDDNDDATDAKVRNVVALGDPDSPYSQDCFIRGAKVKVTAGTTPSGDSDNTGLPYVERAIAVHPTAKNVERIGGGVTLEDLTDRLAQGSVFTVAGDTFSKVAHGLRVGDAAAFTTTGTLPTDGGTAAPLTADPYFVVAVPTADTFKVSATRGGTAVTTTDAGTGTHSFFAPTLISLTNPAVLRYAGHKLDPEDTVRFNGTGDTLPTGFALATNYYVLRTADLGTATLALSKASKAVAVAGDTFTCVGHGLAVDDAVAFTSTGSLPTGISLVAPYYVVAVPTGDTFKVSATKGGAAITTSGSQSGTHTFENPTLVTKSAHGLVVGDNVSFTTTSLLPNPVVAGQRYTVVSVRDADSFVIALALGALPTATASGASQAGTHTLQHRLSPDSFTLSTTLNGAPVAASGSQAGSHKVYRRPQPRAVMHDGGVLGEMNLNNTILNPLGNARPGDVYEFWVTTTTSRSLNWGAGYSAALGIALPTQTKGGGVIERFRFVWSAALALWVLTESSQQQQGDYRRALLMMEA